MSCYGRSIAALSSGAMRSISSHLTTWQPACTVPSGLDTVDDVVAEMDSVSVADVLPARCAHPAHQGQPADGVPQGSARPARSRLHRRPRGASEIRQRCNSHVDPQREIAGSVLPGLGVELPQRCAPPLRGVAAPLSRALESMLRARRVRRSRVSDSGLVKEGQVTAQLLAECECLALEPVTIGPSAFRLAQQLRNPPHVTLYVVGVVDNSSQLFAGAEHERRGRLGVWRVPPPSNARMW